MPPASLATEERRVNRACRVCHCQDPVEGTGFPAPLAPPGPLGSRATQMESWNASLGRQGTRVLPEFQGSRG